MNNSREITDYIKKTTANIINMDKFDVVGEFEDDEKKSYLIHFVAAGKCREIEFLAETEGTNKPITYYCYENNDLIPITDLNQYISDETLRCE